MAISFIETLFYLSLVITFILLLLLIYRFKSSLTILEKKTSIMYNIINDLVIQQNQLISNNYSNNGKTVDYNGNNGNPVDDNGKVIHLLPLHQIPLPQTYFQSFPKFD